MKHTSAQTSFHALFVMATFWPKRPPQHHGLRCPMESSSIRRIKHALLEEFLFMLSMNQTTMQVQQIWGPFTFLKTVFSLKVSNANKNNNTRSDKRRTHDRDKNIVLQFPFSDATNASLTPASQFYPGLQYYVQAYEGYFGVRKWNKNPENLPTFFPLMSQIYMNHTICLLNIFEGL